MTASAAPAGAPRSATFGSRAAVMFGTNLAVAVLSLANVLVVSRYLGAGGRGAVAFLTTIAFLASNLAAFGVQEAHANIAGSEPSARPALATNSIILAGAFGSLCIVALLALTAAFPGITGDDHGPLLMLTLAAIPMLIFQLYIKMIAQASYGFAVTNAAWVIGPVVNVVGNGAAKFAGVLTVGTAVETWIGGQLVGTLVLVWWVMTRSAGFGAPDVRLLRRAVVFGVKSHPGRVMLLGNYRLDQWILGALAGTRELGLYSVAVAWSETLFYLPTALSLVQRPDLVRVSKAKAREETASAFRAGIVATAVLAAGVFLAAPFLCVTIFGPTFAGSVEQLRILTLGAFGIVALKQLGNALTAQQFPVLNSAMMAIAFVVVTALDFALIPTFGGVGAAVASTIAYTTGGIAIGAAFRWAMGGRGAELLPRPGDLTRLWAGARAMPRAALAAKSRA